MKSIRLLLPCLSLALTAPAVPAAETPAAPPPADTATKPPVYTPWQVNQLTPLVNKNLNSGRSFKRGQELFTSLGCAICHSFGGGENVGGIGPDLTGVGGRYGVRDILDSIINPSNNISNLFGSWIIKTTTGKDLGGKVMVEDEDEISVAENVFDLTKITKIKRAEIASMEESTISLMPPGLINLSSESEIEDLLAYLISGGDSTNRMFRPATPTAPAK